MEDQNEYGNIYGSGARDWKIYGMSEYLWNIYGMSMEKKLWNIEIDEWNIGRSMEDLWNIEISMVGMGEHRNIYEYLKFEIDEWEN